MVVAGDEDDGLALGKHLCDIHEVLDCAGRLVFYEEAVRGGPAAGQQAVHDLSFGVAGDFVLVAAGQDQARIGVLPEIGLGRVHPEEQVVRRVAVFERHAEDDGVIRVVRGAQQAAADHPGAEVKNHNADHNHGGAQQPAHDPQDEVLRPGEDAEADVQRKEQQNKAEDKLIPEDEPVAVLQNHGVDFVEHHN